MSQQNQNVDTTFTKIYVGGLAWTTRAEGLRNYFECFGEIIHANVVCDRATDRSQGYGFVTFRDAESATRALLDPKPTIDGRTTNCNLASAGANVHRNQSNVTVLRHDDLSLQFPRLWQNQQQPSNCYLPLPYGPYAGPYWNQFYPQHPQPYVNYSQCYNYQQPYSQCYNYQQPYLQHNGQYGSESYQPYNMNPWYWANQSTNVVNEEVNSLANTAPSTPTSSPTNEEVNSSANTAPSTPTSSPTRPINTTMAPSTPTSSPTRPINTTMAPSIRISSPIRWINTTTAPSTPISPPTRPIIVSDGNRQN